MEESGPPQLDSLHDSSQRAGLTRQLNGVGPVVVNNSPLWTENSTFQPQNQQPRLDYSRLSSHTAQDVSSSVNYDESSLHRLADTAVFSSSDHAISTSQSDFIDARPSRSSHTSTETCRASLQDVNCWDYSRAPLPYAHEIESVKLRNRMSDSCMRFLLAKNIKKHDGLVLLAPSYFTEWARLSPPEMPIPPKCFQQSSGDTRAQTILVPVYDHANLSCSLLAVSRSALGISDIYCFPEAENSLMGLAARFFAWAFQSYHQFLFFRSLGPPNAWSDPSSGIDFTDPSFDIRFILIAMELASNHGRGQLPSKIHNIQGPNDIIAFRQLAVIQLTSVLNTVPSTTRALLQLTSGEERSWADLEGNRSYRFVRDNNGLQRKRQKLEGGRPCRSGPLPKPTLAESKEVRKRGGACERCKKLKKKCDGNEPCNQCRKRDPKKTSDKWSGPCVRGGPKITRPGGLFLDDRGNSEASAVEVVVMEDLLLRY